MRTTDVRLVTRDAVQRCAPSELLSALARDDGFVTSASDRVIITSLLTITATMSALLLVRSKRRGWW